MSKKNQNTKKNQDQEFGTLTAVPDGFTTRLGPNDKEFVVPQYLIPALDQAFVTFRKKVDLEVLKAKPQVSHGAISTESFAASRHCHTYHRHRVICQITALPYLPFPAVSRQLYLLIVSLAYLFYDRQVKSKTTLIPSLEGSWRIPRTQ